MPNHSIYALCEPGTLNVRYVGVTSQPIHVRLSSHLSKTKSSDRPGPLWKWIDSVLSSGKKPDIILLDQCPSSVAKDAEAAWIVAFIDSGYDMLNVHNCFGKGEKGRAPAPREKQSSRVKKETSHMEKKLTRQNVRMIGVTDDLHAEIKELATRDGLTIYVLIARAISAYKTLGNVRATIASAEGDNARP